MNAVDEYIRLADAWGASMEKGDSDAANALHDRIQEVYQFLCQAMQENRLFERANTANDSACFFIASHLKELDPPKAMRLYERLAHSVQPFVAMSAQQIMNEITAHDR